jgi:beta-glucanase (GH16 family)
MKAFHHGNRPKGFAAKARGCGWLLVAFSLSPTPAPAQPPLPNVDPSRWTQTFDDGFDGTVLDITKWQTPTMGRQFNTTTKAYNSYWKPAQVKVEGGFLKLGIKKVVTNGVTTYDVGCVRGAAGYNTPYTFKQKYGYFEARYKLPEYVNKDYWASFWIMAGPVATIDPILGVETDTRKAQEIDIMESFTLTRATHTANFHWGGYDANGNIHHNKTSIPLTGGPTTGWAKSTMLATPRAFNTYGFYWDKDVYVFYLNGTEIGRTNMIGIGANVNPSNPTHPAQGTNQTEGYMHLSCEASTWPGADGLNWDSDAPDLDEFVIDYVKVYDLKPTFTDNPVLADDAAENRPYLASLAGYASDASDGTLTFAKVPLSGPAWLNVAADGTLSGTPTSSDVGVQSFDVTVSDQISTVQGTLQIRVKSAFEAWSSGSASTFGSDGNGDGVPDGIAWLLGSTSPGQRANDLLPTARRSNDGGCTVSFTCLDATKRGSSSLILQYSNDIGVADAWDSHSVIIPTSSGTDPSSGVEFVITSNGDINQIQATIPASASGGTGRIFARLKAMPAP